MPFPGEMSISQTLFDAIQKLEAELQQPEEYGPLLAQEVDDLVQRKKVVQLWLTVVMFKRTR